MPSSSGSSSPRCGFFFFFFFFTASHLRRLQFSQMGSNLKTLTPCSLGPLGVPVVLLSLTFTLIYHLPFSLCFLCLTVAVIALIYLSLNESLFYEIRGPQGDDHGCNTVQSDKFYCNVLKAVQSCGT